MNRHVLMVSSKLMITQITLGKFSSSQHKIKIHEYVENICREEEALITMGVRSQRGRVTIRMTVIKKCKNVIEQIYKTRKKQK